MKTLRNSRRRNGFTVLELMIVVAVIGLLSVLAIPSFAKARQKSLTIKCMKHLRLVDEAVPRYEMDFISSLYPLRNNGVQLRTTLVNAGYISIRNAFECPASRTLDYDDIHLLYQGQDFVRSYCTIDPATHVLP